MEELHGDSGEDLLYHYTNGHALLQIIDSGTLWATHYAYLNDSAELGAGFRNYVAALKQRAAEMPAELSDPTFDEPEVRLAAVQGAIERIENRDDRRGPWITSFCGSGDLLSQWRGYTDGPGYALGFRKEFLETIPIGTNGWIQPAGREFTASWKGEAWANLIKVSYTLSRAGDDVPDLSALVPPPQLGLQSDRVADGLYDEAVREVARIKDEAFIEENEWRLVASASSAAPEFSFRVDRGVVVPYIKMPIDIAEALAVVVLGPSSDQGRRRASLQTFLDTRAVPAEIRESKAPFRG